MWLPEFISATAYYKSPIPVFSQRKECRPINFT
jgi:hypothetical protein